MRRFVLMTLFCAPFTYASGQTLTTGLPLGSVFFGWGAELNLATFLGQTFVVPEGMTSLAGFEFGAIAGPAGTSNFRYRAGIQAWDPVTNTAVGPVLFSSEDRTRLDPTTLAFQAPSFLTGGISVTPGQAYVAFLTALGWAPPSRDCYFPIFDPHGPNCYDLSLMSIAGGSMDTYAEGHVVLPPGYCCLLTAVGFPMPNPNTADLRLTVSFAPEPASWMLTATGLVAIAAVARRRRIRNLPSDA